MQPGEGECRRVGSGGKRVLGGQRVVQDEGRDIRANGDLAGEAAIGLGRADHVGAPMQEQDGTRGDRFRRPHPPPVHPVIVHDLGPDAVGDRGAAGCHLVVAGPARL